MTRAEGDSAWLPAAVPVGYNKEKHSGESYSMATTRKHYSRRDILAGLGAMAAGGALFDYSSIAMAGKPDGLIKDIRRSVIFAGRSKTSKGSWFHARACIVPTSDGPLALMTTQHITGSDYFHPVCWTISRDLGRTWSEPRPIPGMGRRPFEGDIEVGVCDVVPEYHASTRTVSAIGHNVFYRKGKLFRPQPPRCPVYSVRDADGKWSEPEKIIWDDPRGSQIYSCGSSQRVTLTGGDLLIPIIFASKGRYNRQVTSLRCSFDGRKIMVKESGSALGLPQKRGLGEPSLTSFGGRFWMTLRAEDDHGHVSVSDDGLQWSKQKPWSWDDGRPLAMSSTQQHWLTHGDGLFLVYMRRTKDNAKVFRWRAPLFVAQVDPERRCLIRETERVALPLAGDAIRKPKWVARMGNFGVCNVTPDQSWITVGECIPPDGWRGDTLLARVVWNRPNRLVEN